MLNPPVRVIVHAGFYKTGTTTLQAFLAENQRRIAPYAAIYMGPQLGAATSLGRHYGQLPVFWRRRRFGRAMDNFLTTVENAPCIVISRESFSGMMIGYARCTRPTTRYSNTAIPLAREIRRAVVARFGADVDLTFVYTTRARDAVIRSSYGHVLRSSQLKDSAEDFAARFPATFNLDAEAAEIRRALAPTPVLTISLEDHATDRFGTAGPLMDLIGIPPEAQRQMVAVSPKNVAKPLVLQEQFLKLNRTVRDKIELDRQKHRLVQRWKVTRQQKS